MADFPKKELVDVRRGLDDRRIVLKNRLGQVEADLASSHSKGFAEQATEREQDEVLQVEERVFQVELDQIDAAIDRLDNDLYGNCTRCGGPIAKARLAVQPEAPFCMNCAG